MSDIISFILQIQNERGEQLRLSQISIHEQQIVAETINRAGFEHVMTTYVTLTRVLESLRANSHIDIPHSILKSILNTFCSKTDQPSIVTVRSKENAREYRDWVTALTYRHLTEREISYEQAAHIASVLLDRHYSAEAWRKHVSRWAERQGLEKPDLRRKGQQLETALT